MLFQIALSILIAGSDTIQINPRISCLSCSRVIKPADCSDISHCAPGEICSTEKYISDRGYVFYRLGCKSAAVCTAGGHIVTSQEIKQRQNVTSSADVKRKRLTTNAHQCDECCDTPICNRLLCQGTGVIDASLGCLACTDVSTMEHCNSLKHCRRSRDEVCFAIEKITSMFTLLYDAGCMTQQKCKAFARNGNTVCCNETFCNREAGMPCLACSRITKPEDCRNVVQCRLGEICITEEYTTADGHLLYNLGCKSSKECAAGGYMVTTAELKHRQNAPVVGRKRQNTMAPTCRECCDTEYCNNFLCQSTAGSALECLSCSNVGKMSDCKHIQLCNKNEVCYSTGKITNQFDLAYSGGCMSHDQCQAFLDDQRHVSSASQYTPCFTCCDSSFCNSVCEIGTTNTTPM